VLAGFVFGAGVFAPPAASGVGGDTSPVCPEKSGVEAKPRHHERQVYSVGAAKPTRVKVRRPVAWMARERETKLWESIDKAIMRMVSKSSGRNVSEGRGGLEMSSTEGRALG
jgi:hypothetical protein